MTSVITAPGLAGFVSSIPFVVCGVVLFRAVYRRLRARVGSSCTITA